MPDKLEQSDQRGWFRRFFYTPFGDLRRGKLTGRLDIVYRFEAEFGKPLAKHIATIISKARLFEGEQILAAEELADGCRKEIAGGASAEQLIDRLKTRPTQKSIRKRYVRRRGWKIRYLPHLFVIILLIYPFWIAGVTAYYYNSHPAVKVDYVALLNERAFEISEPERAWPLYREALLGSNLLNDGVPLGVGLAPTHPGWPEVLDFLDKHEASVNQLRQAGGMPGMGLTVGYKGHYQGDDARLFEKPEGYGRFDVLPDGTYVESKQVLLSDIHLPHLGPLRVTARLLIADAYRALGRDDPDLFCKDIEAICGVADHASEIKFSICGLVGLQIRNTAYGVINDVLFSDSDKFEDRHLEILFDVLDTGSDLRLISLDSGSYEGLDLIQRIYTDDGRGGGHLTPALFPVIGSEETDGWLFGEGLLQRVMASAYLAGGASEFPNRAEFTRLADSAYRRYEHDLITPKRQHVESGQANEWDDLEQYSELAQILIIIAVPNHEGIRWSIDRSDGIRVALMAGIALERYRRDHGVWVESLEQLMPTYLTALPVDPFTGKPAFYKIVNGHPLIYSVGADRDDDGGSIPINPHTGKPDSKYAAAWQQSNDNPIDGDWVLYPARPTLRESGESVVLPEAHEPVYEYGSDGYGGTYFRDHYGDPKEVDTPDP